MPSRSLHEPRFPVFPIVVTLLHNYDEAGSSYLMVGCVGGEAAARKKIREGPYWLYGQCHP